MLSLSSFSVAEREFSLDGQPLGGDAQEEFKKLLRRPNSSSELIEFSEPTDWRQPESNNIVLMTLASGDVWIELATQFAPLHVENIKTLITQRYFDNTAVIRSQDNYVVQWGDANADTENAKSLGKAKTNLPVEFFRKNMSLNNFTVIDSKDAYADQVGFVAGFPIASDASKAWLAHCYGMVGVGRVLSGMHHLSTLARGTGELGFYEKTSEHVNVQSIQLDSELDAIKRKSLPIQILRTDTFQQYVTKAGF